MLGLLEINALVDRARRAMHHNDVTLAENGHNCIRRKADMTNIFLSEFASRIQSEIVTQAAGGRLSSANEHEFYNKSWFRRNTGGRHAQHRLMGFNILIR